MMRISVLSWDRPMRPRLASREPASASNSAFGPWKFYWLTLALYLCALWSKTATIGLPAVILGMVTPYAVKLRVSAVPNLGTGVGAVSSVSTLGGITGTLLTAFYLVGWLGTHLLFVLNGIVLLVFGLALVTLGRLLLKQAVE